MEAAKNIFSNAFKVDRDQECWQDCEVRFDVKVADIALRSGEIVCDGELDSVEDLKGGNGELGSLKVTNLRYEPAPAASCSSTRCCDFPVIVRVLTAVRRVPRA